MLTVVVKLKEKYREWTENQSSPLNNSKLYFPNCKNIVPMLFKRYFLVLNWC